MATKKTSGVTKIAKLILGGKSTSKQKTRKPSSAMNRMATKIGQAFPELGINHSIKALSTSDFSDINFKGRLSSIASAINLDTRWSKLGREMAMQIDNESDGIVDVSNNAAEEFDDVQHNFDIVQKQIGVLSQFMIRLDYKFIDLQRNIKSSIVKSNSEVVKNQIVVVDKVNKKLEGVDTNVKNIKQRIELHDRQLDELYAEFKAKNKTSKVHDFLVGRRKGNPFPSFADSPSNKDDPEKDGGLGILGLLTPETIAAIGAMGASGVAAAGYGTLKLGSKTLKGVGKGFSAGNRLGARVGMRVGGKLGAKIGGKLIPGVGILLTAKDFYDGYKHDGIKGGIKNAATLGFAYGDEDPRSKEDSKSVKDDIRIVSEGNIILEAKKKLTLKADTIFFDAKKIEFAGTVVGTKDQVKAFEQKAQNKGGWFGWGGFPGKQSQVLPGNNKPDSLPGPNMGSFGGNKTSIGSGIGSYSGGGRSGSSGRGSLGGGDWNVNPAIAGQKQSQIAEKPESVLSNVMSNKSQFGTLAQQRSKFQKEIDSNPELKKTLAALAISEEGQKSSSSQTGVVETMMNRAAAQGKSLSEIVKRHAEPGKNYYAPYFDGAFDKNMALLNKNPELYNKVSKSIDAALAGSNYSNFGTDNSSAHVAESAKRSQSITGRSEAGETYSRKDRSEFANIHGKKVVENNRRWHHQTLKAIEQENKQFKLPGMTKVAQADDSNRSLIQKSRQTRMDAAGVSKPSRLDFKTQREYNAASAKYDSWFKNDRDRLEQSSERQSHRVGQINIGEQSFDFGSGDRRGKYPAIPFGSYPIADNYWSKRMGKDAIGINNDSHTMSEIDPKIGRRREGIVFHAGRTNDVDNLYTQGCIGIPPEQWSKFKQAVNKFKKENGGRAYVHIGPDGTPLSISAEPTPGIKQVGANQISTIKASLPERSPISPKEIQQRKESAGEQRLSKVNNVMQSVEAKRAEFHKNPDYKRRPDGPDKQTTYLNNLSDKQKKFALDQTEAANPNLGKKLQIYDGRDRVVSLPGKNQWAQGGPNSAGPAWANGTGRTAVASKASLGGGFKRLSEVNTTKQNVAALKNKVAEVKAQPKQNVAQNGSISGGKKIVEKAPSKVVEEAPKKSEQKVASKQQEEQPRQAAKKSEESTGYRSREEASSKSYNNSADSIPPSPSDDGSGSYKRCLI